MKGEASFGEKIVFVLTSAAIIAAGIGIGLYNFMALIHAWSIGPFGISLIAQTVIRFIGCLCCIAVVLFPALLLRDGLSKGDWSTFKSLLGSS